MSLDRPHIADQEDTEDTGRVDPPAPERPVASASLAVAHPRPGSDVDELVASAVRLARGLLRSRMGLVLIAALVAAGGLALGWEWLAVAGVLPLVLSVLPCVAMCALGLCMRKGGDGKSCSTQKDSGSAVGAKPPANRL
ncbi:MAG: hypothetical protein AB7F94_09100 [Nitrospira sp.]